MIIDIVMPKMGESITEGTILEWKKQVGDTIALDEILLEIGTDKVDSEIPSSAEGVVVEILAKPNDVVEVGKVIAKIDSEVESSSAVKPIEKMEKTPLTILKRLKQPHLVCLIIKITSKKNFFSRQLS